jgi:hypothetical protein
MVLRAFAATDHPDREAQHCYDICGLESTARKHFSNPSDHVKRMKTADRMMVLPPWQNSYGAAAQKGGSSVGKGTLVFPGLAPTMEMSPFDPPTSRPRNFNLQSPTPSSLSTPNPPPFPHNGEVQGANQEGRCAEEALRPCRRCRARIHNPHAQAS